MTPLGLTAYDPQLDPEVLYQASRMLGEEHREEVAGFAHDLATILNLPVAAAAQDRAPLTALDPQRLP
jgi:hypothetical protein